MAAQNPVEIREANERDLDAIAHILVDTWRSTFRGRLSDEFLDSLSYEGQRKRHIRTMAGPTTAYYVAACPRTHEIIGFANGGPNRHSEYLYAGELYAIYILEEFQRRGMGKMLFCALASRLLQS